jgi:hypothetical protein
VSRSTYHACGRYEIDDHFAGKDPAVRGLFDHLFKTLKKFGRVTAHATKTRIVFQAETQFAAVITRRRWLEGTLWLRRRAQHPGLRRIEMGVFRDYGHVFRLALPADLDPALVALLHEAYLIGGRALAAGEYAVE